MKYIPVFLSSMENKSKLSDSHLFELFGTTKMALKAHIEKGSIFYSITNSKAFPYLFCSFIFVILLLVVKIIKGYKSGNIQKQKLHNYSNAILIISLSFSIIILSISLYKSNADKNILYTSYKNLYNELSFYRNNAVIITEYGTKYHKYGCDSVKNSDFWIINKSIAEEYDYEKCTKCFK